jgi:hypothetical protein
VPELKLQVVIEKKHEQSPAFVVVPAAKLAPWKLTGTTTVDASLDGVALGRRSLHRWDERGCWFLELRRDQLEALGKSPGERAALVVRRASEVLPDEQRELIEAEPKARARWEALTQAQQRMLREHVLSAKGAATRARRARGELLPAPAPKPPPVKGLRAARRTLVVRIVARRLPGRTCGPYTDVTVHLAQKTGCAAEEGVVSASARQAQWETAVEVFEQDGRPAFRGPAVNGPPQERFLYLTWIGQEGGAAPAMFRRAKLRLDAVPAPVLASALKAGLLVGRLELTAADGMPVCASVRPPAITWAPA